MAEDGLIGFNFFTNPNGASIADEEAVLRASSLLINPTAHGAAAGQLGNAKQAVQEAIRGKALRDEDRSDGFGDGDFIDGFDFIL